MTRPRRLAARLALASTIAALSSLLAFAAQAQTASAAKSAEAKTLDAKSTTPAPRDEGSPLVVVLDPGHGGPWPHDGAHGTKGLLEKVVALQIARRLQTQLEAAGATVLLTREDDDTDVSLADRARFANEANADLFVSIHCNSMATRHDRSVTRGIESYFLSPDSTDAEARLLAEMENGGPSALPVPKTTDAVTGLLADLALGQARNDSAVLAETLQRALIHKTFATSRGVRQAPFLVLSGTRMPSALVEIGFISHPVEGRLLAKESYQNKIAEALALGIRDFAARVLLRRLLPPTDDGRAALLARRSEAAHLRAAHRSAPGESLAHKPSLAGEPAATPAPMAATPMIGTSTIGDHSVATPIIATPTVPAQNNSGPTGEPPAPPQPADLPAASSSAKEKDPGER